MSTQDCTRCNYANETSAKFCNQCGERIREPERFEHQVMDEGDTAPRQNLCPGCTRVNNPEAMFCFDCGLRLTPHLVRTTVGDPVGLGIRLGAGVLDLLAIAAIMYAVTAGMEILAGTAWERALEASWNELPQRLIGREDQPWQDIALETTIDALYFTLFTASWGATIGKRLMGIRVIRLDGSPIGYGRSLLRYLAYFVSFVPLGLGFLWIALSANHRGWHDHLVDTRVVRARAGRTHGAV